MGLFFTPGNEAALSRGGGCSPCAAVSAVRDEEVLQPPQQPVGSGVLSPESVFSRFALLGTHFGACRGSEEEIMPCGLLLLSQRFVLRV